MVLNSNDIQKIIPHRQPFLLVDRIDELEIGYRAKGIKCITANELQFWGHFPDEHIMPGILIIEALAQVGAVAILADEKGKNKKAYFAGIKKARFRRKVVPGDVLTLEAKLIKIRGLVGIAECRATVDNELACNCIISFVIS